MKKKLTSILIVIMFLVSFGLANAVSLTMDDGTIIPMDGLSNLEKQNVIKAMDTVSKNQRNQNSTLGIPTNVVKSPEDLSKWGKALSGVIKEICQDLGIAVNDFIKTPAGLTITAIIIYKVAGKDLISKFFDIILAIPMWIIMMSILYCIQRKYLVNITFYRNKVYNRETKKYDYTNGNRIESYDWNSHDAKFLLGIIVYGSAVIITIVTLIIIFG